MDGTIAQFAFNSMFNGKLSSPDYFERRVRRYLHKDSKRKIWIIAVVAIIAVFALQGMLRGGFDQFSQSPAEPPKEFGVENVPSIITGLNFAEQQEEVVKTICVYDEYSKKGIKNVKIFIDDRGVGRTTQFGCSDVSILNDNKEHAITIEGKSLLEPFDHTQMIEPDTADETLEFYVDLYDDEDLHEIAYITLNDFRTRHNLPAFKHGDDLNAQKWTEFLHRGMMTDNGMMENAQAQIVQTHGYIKKLQEVLCKNDRVDCPPTYYTYTCESDDCIIERGEAVKRIIDGMLGNKFVRSTQFSYVTIGISYDERVMFLVVNFA